jgi:cytochrome c-type biogenesis protein CcmH
MIAFLVVALVLMAAGLAALLWPLLRQDKGDKEKSAGAIVAVFRDQLRELEAERAGGGLDEAQYEQNRREIERRLLEDVAGGKEDVVKGPQRARWTAALVGAFVIVLPIGLYVVLGTPEAMVPGMIGPAGSQQQAQQGEGARKVQAGPITSAQVQKMIDGLVEALKKAPNDVEGWSMLARAYAYQHQYPDAVRAFTRAVELNPKSARLLADLADAMAMANGQRLDGEPMKLIDRALQIDPKEVKALALAGTNAFDHQQYAKAVKYWESALQNAPAGEEFSESLKKSLEEARQLAGQGATPGGVASSGATPAPPAAMGSGAPEAMASVADPAGAAPAATAPSGSSGVRGKVTLAAGLAAKAQPGDTVFVFARAAQGPRVPLALVRRQVKDLPFEFALDDSMAMMPEYTLSKYSPVIVGARISHSGDAIAAPGDLQGFSKPVAVGANAVAITIDQVVQ